jgi:hypothetical protein
MKFNRPPFIGHHVVVAENQPEYQQVPALIVAGPGEPPGHLLCIELDLEERVKIAEGGHVYIQLLTMGGPMTPIRVSFDAEEMAGWLQLELDL